MKTLSVFMLVFMCSVGFCFSQATQNIRQDSVIFEAERKIIAVQQIQLRDSINQSLSLVDTKIKNASPAKKKKLEQARKDLLLNKEVLQRYIDETGLTAKNSWTDENVERLKMNVDQVRREHRRLQSGLKN
jgi:hypothetical protein